MKKIFSFLLFGVLSLFIYASGITIGGKTYAVDTIVHLSLIHISEPTRQAEISYAVFCLKKKKKKTKHRLLFLKKKK